MMRIGTYVITALLLSAMCLSLVGTGAARAFTFDYNYQKKDPVTGESTDVKCQSADIQDAIGKLQGSYLTQLESSAIEQVKRMLKTYAPQIAQCLATSAGLLGNKPPQPFNCMVSVGGEIGNQLEQQYLNRLKRDFVGSCTARSAFVRSTNDARRVISEGGRDGGPAFVEDWQAFMAQSRNRGRKIALNQMANTQYCPWLQEPLQGMFGFSAADAVPPSNAQRDGGPSYMDAAACNAPNGYSPFDPKWQTAEGLAILMQPQNNIWGAYLLAESNIGQQVQDAQAQDQNEFVYTGGVGALRSRNPSTGTSCRVYTADGSTCLEYTSIKQPAAGVQAEINAQRQAEYDSITNIPPEQITDPYAHLISSLLDATTEPIEAEYGLSQASQDLVDNPGAIVTPLPTPGGGGGGGATCAYASNSQCTCLDSNPGAQVLATTIVQNAVLAAIQQQIGISVSPDGNSVLPGQERFFLDAVCHASVFGTGETCRINGASTTEIVIAGGVYDYVVTVLSANGTILKPGTVVAACTTGTL